MTNKLRDTLTLSGFLLLTGAYVWTAFFPAMRPFAASICLIGAVATLFGLVGRSAPANSDARRTHRYMISLLVVLLALAVGKLALDARSPTGEWFTLGISIVVFAIGVESCLHQKRNPKN